MHGREGGRVEHECIPTLRGVSTAVRWQDWQARASPIKNEVQRSPGFSTPLTPSRITCGTVGGRWNVTNRSTSLAELSTEGLPAGHEWRCKGHLTLPDAMQHAGSQTHQQRCQ